MVRLLILLLPVLGLSLWSSQSAPPAQAQLPLFRSPLMTGASIACEARASALDPDPAALFGRAVDLGEQLEGALPIDRRRQLRTELALLLAGLGRHPDAAAFPWRNWIESCRQAHRTVAPGLMLAAGVALGESVRPIAREFNQRDCPEDLRVAAVKSLWRLDEMYGFNACQRALREPPRFHLHEKLVSEVLRHCPRQRAEELLLDAVSHTSSVSERAKRLAAEELGRRRAEAAIGILGQILDSERGNVELRKEAGLALMAIGTDEALRAILRVDSIDARAEPVFFEFLNALRQEIGVPPMG